MSRACLILPFLLWGLTKTAFASGSVNDQGDLTCHLLKAVLPTNYAQKTIEVPEDWSNPNGPKINIFYYWNEKALHESQRTPVLFFNNGPASSSYGSFLNFRSQGLSDLLPLVFMDQRGTGCSSPYPSEVERIRHYGTRSIVLDAETIRKQLIGLSGKWNVFGHNYGGLIVRRYLEIAPRSVATAVSYGYSGANNPEQLAARYLAQKQALDRFLIRYIDMESYLQKLRAKLDDVKPCFGNQYSQVCGRDIIDLVGFWLIYQENWVPLREELLKLLDSRGDINDNELTIFARSHFNMNPNTSLAHIVLSILELTAEPFDASDLWGTKRAIHLLQSRRVDPLSWLISEARWDMVANSVERAFAAKPIARDPLNHRQIALNLLLPQGPRFLMYAGQRDDINPPNALYADYNRYAPRAQLKIFLQLGHEGAFSPQVWRDAFPEFFAR